MVAVDLTSSSKLSVNIIKVDKVVPAEKREDHVFWLSNLDQNVATIIKTVDLYPAKEGVKADPVEVVRDALVKLLEYYYPLAGRLGISPEMKLMINYASQGVVFVSASTEATLADLGDISKPDQRLQELVYDMPDATNILETPLVTAQVTKFKCGGFSFGMANQHSCFDGIGAVNFMKCWGEMARGLPLSTVPSLDRSMLRCRMPPQPEFPHDEFAEIEDISKNNQLAFPDVAYSSFLLTPSNMEALKKDATQGDVTKCSTFEVLTALMWRSRTKAFEMEPEQRTRVWFAVDGRKKINPPLPDGYVGNGIMLTFAMTTSADLCGKPLSHAVKLVQNAIGLIDDRYMRSAIDYYEMTRARPNPSGSMIVTTWSRLAFQGTDFGWGAPAQSGPASVPDPHILLFVSHPKEKGSINVLTGLPKKVMGRFEETLKEKYTAA